MRMEGNVFEASTYPNQAKNQKRWDRDESDHRGHNTSLSVLPEERKICSAKTRNAALQKFVDTIIRIEQQQPGTDDDNGNNITENHGDFTFNGGRRHLYARRFPAMFTAHSELRMCQRCTTDGNSRFSQITLQRRNHNAAHNSPGRRVREALSQPELDQDVRQAGLGAEDRNHHQ